MEDARLAMLNILEWYSESTVGAAFLHAYDHDREAVVFNLYANWMDIQEGLWVTGRSYWKKKFLTHSDRQDVERYLANVREWSKGKCREFSAELSPGALQKARDGVSQSGNWGDALARWVLRNRVARRRALACMSAELAQSVAYDRQADPCQVIRGECVT